MIMVDRVSLYQKIRSIMGMVTKKGVIIAIGCIVLIQIIISFPHTTSSKKFVPSTMDFSNINILVYMKPVSSGEYHVEAETVEEIIVDDQNIFFLETAHIKNSDQINLNARQGCAVESAALMNPTMKVYLFIFCNESLSYSNKTETILTQLRSYENIVIRLIHLETYFKNTPVDEWWNTTDNLSSSLYFIPHMSDILRYLTMWKFGGIYLDLDVVTTKSLEHLKDFAAVEYTTSVAAGVLGFHLTDTGRRVANQSLFEMITDFRGDIWAHNGPGVITRTLKKICDTETICEMDADRCDGFTLFPPSIFFPISGGFWERYFDNINKNRTMKKINNAMAIHVWNNASHSREVKVGSQVPYELIASKSCPKVYNTCTITF